jgi:hypothetical protein
MPLLSSSEKETINEQFAAYARELAFYRPAR